MRNPHPLYMIALSGGLDSIYALWKWFNTWPGESIVIHHVELRHRAENRLEPERRAVENIMNWFRAQGYDNFFYHTSGWDYGDIPRIHLKDIQIVAMFSAALLKMKEYSTVNNLILSWHKGEVNAPSNNRGFRVRNMLRTMEVPRYINFLFPIEHLTRRQMVEELPEELLSFVHSCRSPLNEDGEPCGKCIACKQYLKEGLEVR